MSDNNTVTLKLTQNEAEALFCILRTQQDDKEVYNNVNGLTFHDTLPSGEHDTEEEQDDMAAWNEARIRAAKQLYAQLTPERKERHNYDPIVSENPSAFPYLIHALGDPS